MQRNKDGKTINPQDYDFFVGMDVDKRSISVAVLDWTGVLLQKKFPYDGAAILACLRRKFPEGRFSFVYETGPTGFGLYDALTEAGELCLIVPAQAVSDRKLERVKTNRVDAKKLGEELRGGKLYRVFLGSDLLLCFKSTISVQLHI